MNMDVWIVVAAVVAGFAGYGAGYRRGFAEAKHIGMSLACDLAKAWGKTPQELGETVLALTEEER